MSRGAEALSDRELLALVLRSGTRTVSALDLAESLLAEHQSLAALSKAHAEELATSSGIGIAKATALVETFSWAGEPVKLEFRVFYASRTTWHGWRVASSMACAASESW